MKAVVIGATGATGRALVRQLLATEWVTQVIVLVRRASFERQSKLEEHIIDFAHLEGFRDLIVGDLAFSCLGTTLQDAGSKEAQWMVDYTYQYNFAQLAYQNGIPTFVLQSAMNANPSSKLFYSRMKGELEENIKIIGFEKLIMCKPSFLIRPKSTRLLERLSVRLFQGFRFIGLFEDYAPLSVDVVANAMIQSTLKCTQRVNELSVGDLERLNTEQK